MGTVEDVRKMFQDFLAPELRAIDTRLKNIAQSYSELKAELKEFRGEVKYDGMELRSEVQTLFQKGEERSDTRYKELVTTMSLDARVTRVEEKGTESTALLSFLKDHLLADRSRLEEEIQRSAPQKPVRESGTKKSSRETPRLPSTLNRNP